MKILLIDDEPLVLRAVKRLLASANHDVVTLQRTPWLEELEDIDAVVSDWQPYGWDTYLACREARVPIVIMTGGDVDAVRERVPFIDVLPKPLSKTEILEAINDATGAELLK